MSRIRLFQNGRQILLGQSTIIIVLLSTTITLGRRLKLCTYQLFYSKISWYFDAAFLLEPFKSTVAYSVIDVNNQIENSETGKSAIKPLLLSTGWFQEWIRAWFHNWTKIKGLMEDWLKCQISPLVKYRQNQTKLNIINLTPKNRIPFSPIMFLLLCTPWTVYKLFNSTSV